MEESVFAQAEMDLVCSILSKPELFREVCDVHPSMLSDSTARALWTVIHRHQGRVAAAVIHDELGRFRDGQQVLEAFPDVNDIRQLIIQGATAGSPLANADLIKDRSVEMEFEQAIREYSTLPGTARDRMLMVARRLNDAVGRVTAPEQTADMTEVTDRIVKNWRFRQANPEMLLGIKTHWDQYNRFLRKSGGLNGGKLVVTFAFSNTGKTFWMVDLALNICRTSRDDTGQRPKVRFYSLEMGPDDIVTRVMSQLAQVSILEETSDPDADRRMVDAQAEFNQMTVDGNFVSIHQLHDVDSICRDIYRHRNEGNCDIAFVDYLGLIQGGGGASRSTRYEQIGGVTESLQGLTQELQIPVVTAAQVNRSTLENANRRPDISNIADSMRIYFAADVVHMLWRPELGLAGKNVGMWKDIAVLMTPKVRNGKLPHPMYYRFLPDFSSFIDVTTEEQKLLGSEEQQAIAHGKGS